MNELIYNIFKENDRCIVSNPTRLIIMATTVVS